MISLLQECRVENVCFGDNRTSPVDVVFVRRDDDEKSWSFWGFSLEQNQPCEGKFYYNGETSTHTEAAFRLDLSTALQVRGRLLVSEDRVLIHTPGRLEEQVSRLRDGIDQILSDIDSGVFPSVFIVSQYEWVQVALDEVRKLKKQEMSARIMEEYKKLYE